MAYEGRRHNLTGVVAGADLSAAQHFAVKFSGDSTVVLAGAGEVCAGVLQNDPASGEGATVASVGAECKAVAGAAIAAGAQVEADAAGKLITATTGAVVGRAMTAAGADGELFTLQVTLEGVI